MHGTLLYCSVDTRSLRNTPTMRIKKTTYHLLSHTLSRVRLVIAGVIGERDVNATRDHVKSRENTERVNGVRLVAFERSSLKVAYICCFVFSAIVTILAIRPQHIRCVWVLCTFNLFNLKTKKKSLLSICTAQLKFIGVFDYFCDFDQYFPPLLYIFSVLVSK